MLSRPVLAAMLATLAAPAVAEPVTAGFSPPLDRELRYDTIEQHNLPGMAPRFTLDQRVAFRRTAEGYVMAVRLQSARSDARPQTARRFEAAFAPFVGLTTEVRLSPAGSALGMADEAGYWQALTASIARLKAGKEAAPEIAAGIESVFGAIAAMPAGERAAKLIEAPLRLVGYALPPMEPGRPLAMGDAADLRGQLSVTLRQVAADTLHYTIESVRPIGEALVTSVSEIEVDRRTGLLRRATIRDWVGPHENGAAPAIQVTVQALD